MVHSCLGGELPNFPMLVEMSCVRKKCCPYNLKTAIIVVRNTLRMSSSSVTKPGYRLAISATIATGLACLSNDCGILAHHMHPRLQLNTNSISIAICTSPLWKCWFRWAWHQPSTAIIHSQLVCALINLLKFCVPLPPYVHLAPLTCYLPLSIKARSLACSPGFAGLLQKTHEQGQCGISVAFSTPMCTSHEHRFKEQFNTIYVIQHESMKKLLAGLPDSACCMPLSAEQAGTSTSRSCQLFPGKNRFCQP